MLNNNPKDFNDVDGLNIVENPDGTFQVEWDENDPRYSMFKGLSEAVSYTHLTLPTKA